MIVLYKYFSKTTDEDSRKWFQYILDHPDKQWNYEDLSRNPNITWEIVQANPDKPWDYDNLSINLMTKHPYYIGHFTEYVLK